MLAAFADFVLKRALAQVPTGFSRATLLPKHAQKASQALLEAARQSASDLIVVGAGRSSHRLPFLLGGVARSVIHESDRPVLAYRATEDSPPSGPLRVLLAADPVEPFDMAVDILRQFSWPAGSRGQVLHVIDYVEDERLRHWINHSATPSSFAWNAAMDQEVQTERARVREQLKLLQQRLPDIFHRDEPTLTVGHVVQRIVEAVESEGIDLVVVGGRRRGLVSRLLGSTTEGLLLQAKASVLVLHDASPA